MKQNPESWTFLKRRKDGKDMVLENMFYTPQV